jgi:hypothetical protein
MDVGMDGDGLKPGHLFGIQRHGTNHLAIHYSAVW